MEFKWNCVYRDVAAHGEVCDLGDSLVLAMEVGETEKPGRVLLPRVLAQRKFGEKVYRLGTGAEKMSASIGDSCVYEVVFTITNLSIFDTISPKVRDEKQILNLLPLLFCSP